MKDSPQITIGKKTGLKNLLNIVTTKKSEQHLRHFLKRHYLDFDDTFYQRIEEKRQAILNKLIDTVNPEISKEDEIEENSYTTTYTYIAAAVEKILLQNDINIMTKPISYTAKIAKRSKDKIKKDLIEEFEKTFVELDEFIEQIIPDPTDFDNMDQSTDLEKVLQNAIGHQ